MVKTYVIRFTGRRINAMGRFQTISAERDAESPDLAFEALYDEFEHITAISVTEKQQP